MLVSPESSGGTEPPTGKVDAPTGGTLAGTRSGCRWRSPVVDPRMCDLADGLTEPGRDMRGPGTFVAPREADGRGN